MALYYGVDSYSKSAPCGSDFYIGEIGEGTSADDSYFSYERAQETPDMSNNYSYWGIYGPLQDPDYDGTNNTAYHYGKKQALYCF